MKQITKTFLVAVVAIGLVACTGNNQKNNSTAPDMHTAKISLDWEGTYEGIMPCADCPGIYALLALDDDGTYEMYEKYLERNAVFVSKGKFEWNATEDSVRLLTDGNMVFHVGENELSTGNFRFTRISDDEDLSDSFTEYILKDDATGEDAEVEIYFENNATVADLSFNGKEYKLKENREIGQERVFADGSTSLAWEILDPAPQPDYKPTLTVDGKKYTFTRVTPLNYLFVTDDASAPVKGFDVTYFNTEEGKSFVQLLSSDMNNTYTLPQTEASAKTAVYEKDGVQWLSGDDKATLKTAGKEIVYTQQAITR